MGKKIRIIGILEDNCVVCNSKESIGTPFNFRDVMLFGMVNGSCLIVNHRKKEYMIGFRFKDKIICKKCLEIMVGLEDYYDAFFHRLMFYQPAIELTRKISTNQELTDKVLKKFRMKGNYIPKSFIEKELSPPPFDKKHLYGVTDVKC